MVVHTCPRCQKFTSARKGDIDRHLNRKFTCKPTEVEATQQLHCAQCNAPFAHRQSLCRHEKKCNDVKALRHTIVVLQDALSKRDDLERRVDELAHELQEVSRKNPTLTTINNTMNITINVFGKEDVSYLTEEQREGFLLGKQDGLLSLIKEIHFNPEHPENRTVVLKSSKRKLASVSVGAGRFEVIPLKNAIDTVISNNHKVATKKYMSDAAYREELDSKFKTFEGFGQIQDWNMKLNGCRFAQAEMKRNVYAVFDHERNEIKEGEVNL